MAAEVIRDRVGLEAPVRHRPRLLSSHFERRCSAFFACCSKGCGSVWAYMRPKSIVSAPSFGVARGPSVGMKSWKVGAVCRPSCSVEISP